MKIKDILKENNVKLIELSNILDISRPTLNSYIDEFEREGKISNKEYDSFFKKISKKNYESKEELLGDINEFRELLVNKKFSDLLPENLRLLKNIYDIFNSISPLKIKVFLLLSYINVLSYVYLSSKLSKLKIITLLFT